MLGIINNKKSQGKRMSAQEWLQKPVKNSDLMWEKVREVLIDTKNVLSHEALVEIKPSARLSVYSAYYHDHIAGALLPVYTRESILEKLYQLLEKLPENLGILVLDAWRPIAVQEALRHDFRDNLVVEYPNFNDAQIDEILNQFVAKPSQDPMAPSPHLTGGSIDLTLFDVASNQELDMGTSFDAIDEASWSHYFEESGDLETRQIRDNRRLLIHGMRSVGFSNLPSEWWHFDFGNQLWGYYTENKAFYGITDIKDVKKSS